LAGPVCWPPPDGAGTAGAGAPEGPLVFGPGAGAPEFPRGPVAAPAALRPDGAVSGLAAADWAALGAAAVAPPAAGGAARGLAPGAAHQAAVHVLTGHRLLPPGCRRRALALNLG